MQHLVFALGQVWRLARVLALCLTRLFVTPQYQRRSLRFLYDTLSTLSAAVGSALAPFVASLAPLLLAKWQARTAFASAAVLLTHTQAMVADDREQLPLLECISQIIPAFGASFEPYASPVYQRCVAMLREQLQLGAESDPDFIVCALDALSALTDALRASLEPLAASLQLRDLVQRFCSDSLPAVRQSGFALLGDLAKCQPALLLPALKPCLEVCCAALQPDQLVAPNMRACTNACWALGELVVRAPPEELQALALPLTQVLAPLLSMRASTSKGLLENAGISLGRLALRCPQPIAPYVQSFAEPWCIVLRRARDDVEKEQAFGGLCLLVQQNPLAVWPAFVPLANAFASWRTLRDETLHRSMAEILRGYKAHLPAGEWDSGWARLEPAVRDKLAAWFLA